MLNFLREPTPIGSYLARLLLSDFEPFSTLGTYGEAQHIEQVLIIIEHGELVFKYITKSVNRMRLTPLIPAMARSSVPPLIDICIEGIEPPLELSTR